MSGFKRHRSQVFWGQMEARDRVERPLPIPTEENRDEESEPSDPENTTVIHVEASSENPSCEAALKEEILAERSFSPASRGQRSQDSGFSDSGRSDSSSNSGPRSPRRRRRRRKAKAECPTHTSTPKQEPPGLARTQAQEVLVPRQLDFKGQREPEEELEVELELEEEAIEDFLYTQEEPPGEEREPSPELGLGRFVPELDPCAPVNAWLVDIRLDIDEECTSTLQSKRLPRRRRRDDDEPESRDLRLLTASATTAAKKIIDVADRFDKRHQQALRSISSSKSGRLERDMLLGFETEAADILVKLGLPPPRRIVPQDNYRNVPIQLTRLKNKVDRELDNRLDYYIEKVVLGLEEAPREDGSAARGALAALTALGLAGPRAGASVARCSGIRALLTSLVSAGRLSSQLRCATLRALASVSCCLEAIERFVAEGGPDILADVLADPGTPQAEKSEAAALLVQITAPWMERAGLPHMEPFARSLVPALTDLAEATNCKQTLLLAAAAINNLSHSRRCIAAIVESDSIKKLLRCVKKSNGGSVWLMEQVAALVGCVARVPQARAHLVESRASVALVCFLRMQPPGLEDEYRRLEATAREALTRLCVDREIAKQVVAVGGSDCLPITESRTENSTTKSLRAARRLAAEQIDIARVSDYSPR
ncbi:PREDICTED: uncharacterized protein LOC105365498 isoform X2 [Ceratosolen solmsi marchali]|uniref:Uncharacterized protein LOC105365498 isoform X2 n=1 Tax=Ceratosolen solmsi marchali TaxID=326594 RepID=A0AAJ6YPP7_9HYME|nr:PREDICTED: uncharacterized protein LOC105365498 isoform X2 [Ceratosolen solmsi marchali]